jgi:hypothetical protein
MSELHEGLQLYREQLIEAIDRTPAGRTIRVPRLRWVVPPAAAVVAAVAAVILLADGTHAPSADAATLGHIRAALTAAPGTILHDRALVTLGNQPPQLYELWQQTDNPSTARWIKFGHELSTDGTNKSEYDPASNTITVTPDPGGESRPAVDIADTLRSLVDSGSARVAGTTTLEGIAVYKLTISDAPRPFLDGTAYVSRDTYYPVLIQSTDGPCNCTETIRFQTYEYLPATAANLRLLDLTAQHPGARMTTSPGTTARAK